MLDVELLHNAAEALLEAVDLLIELLTDLEFELVVVLLFAGWRLGLNLLNFLKQLLDHALHGDNLGRATDDIVLLVGVLQDTLAAEHFLVVLAVELDLFVLFNTFLFLNLFLIFLNSIKYNFPVDNLLFKPILQLFYVILLRYGHIINLILLLHLLLLLSSYIQKYIILSGLISSLLF